MSDLELIKAENTELKSIIEDLKLELNNKKHSHELSKEQAKLLGTVHKCKIELKKQPLKKSGYNSHGKYHYFELADFLPCLEVVLDNHGLGSFFYCNDGTAYLNVFEVESGVSYTWDTKLKQTKVRENGFDIGVYMKAEQAVQTYARRTLYLQAFDIVEPNDIEADKTVEKPKNKKKPSKTPVKEPVKQEDVPEARIKEILDYAYAKVVEEQGKDFHLGTALWTIKELCNSDEELQACKKSLQIYTADKINNQ